MDRSYAMETTGRGEKDYPLPPAVFLKPVVPRRYIHFHDIRKLRSGYCLKALLNFRPFKKICPEFGVVALCGKDLLGLSEGECACYESCTAISEHDALRDSLAKRCEQLGVVASKVVRWKKEEVALLLKLVNEHKEGGGRVNWKWIAKQMPSERTAGACRDYYN
eukprot:scaffold96_cov167-Ochromonas_danica.AAC.38